MKRMTRRQVDGWFLPIRRALNEMLTGEVDSIRGYAVTRLHNGDEYERVDWCMAGFVGVLSRIFPELDLSPMTKLQRSYWPQERRSMQRMCIRHWRCSSRWRRR